MTTPTRPGLGDSRGWPFVGREEELAFIEGLESQAFRGVVVAGGSGIGKTRLATEAVAAAAPSGCLILSIRATQAAASVPLGAFVHLLPEGEQNPGGPAELLARARTAVLDRAGDRKLLISVDDAHLLDDTSAALVHQLATSGAFVVVTIRLGESTPDAVHALWKEELCAFLHLRELSREEVERLLHEVLAGDLDGRSFEMIWGATLGNVLFLRELVVHGLERGLLREADGIWRWHGELGVGARLGELIQERLAGLDRTAKAALEIVAVAAPIETHVLGALVDERTLEALESREFVAQHRDGRRRLVTFAHPLFGEAVRDGLARMRVDVIQRALVDQLERAGARRRGDPLRVALWTVDSGGPASPQLLLRASGQAQALLDWPLAELLARAASQAGGGFPARLALARALAGGGGAAAAEELFAGLETEARTERERVEVAVGRVRNLLWGLGHLDEADLVLTRVEPAVTDPAVRDELASQRAWIACYLGRPREAFAAAEMVLDSATANDTVRLRAALSAAGALSLQGRCDELLGFTDAWLPLARRLAAHLPVAVHQLLSMRLWALVFAGRLLEANAIAEQSYEAELAGRSPLNTAVAALDLGAVCLARGRVATARRWYRESATLLRESDPIGFLPWALAGLAQAAALAGDSRSARQPAAEAERLSSGTSRLFSADIERASAWSAAAAGELSRARSVALAAADRAEAAGLDGPAVVLLHDLVRLGDPVTAVSRLESLARRVDGTFATTCFAHAVAVVNADAAALVEAADQFEAMDALLVAAELAATAADVYRRKGRDSSARAAAARAAVLLERCEDAKPPTLADRPHEVDLTRREREVAALAAAGLTTREIADRLVVSMRTIDNHLQHIYRKLGVSGRHELARLVVQQR